MNLLAVLAIVSTTVSVVTSALINPSITNSTGDYYINTISGASFASDTITCSSSDCIIICNMDSGCQYTTIDASATFSLTLRCVNYYSCQHINLINGPITKFDIVCAHEAACIDGQFNAADTTEVSIQCIHLKCSSGCNSNQGACTRAIFNSEYSTNVYIQCGGDSFDCHHTEFNVNHTDTTLINAERSTLYHATVIALDITSSLTINCDFSSSCHDADIYCPINAPCNINCVGQNGCSSTDIYLSTENSLFFNLICSTQSSCDLMTFNCDDTGLVTDYMYSQNNGDYICSTADCCPTEFEPSTNILDCAVLFGVGQDCTIDCSDHDGCAVKTIIDGTDASSLNITCDQSYECQHIDIICPIDSVCTVNCLSSYSCEYARFLHQTVSDLSLTCSSSRSCEYLSMDLIVTGTANITCSGGTSYNCHYINIDLILSSSNTATIICEMDTSCYRGTFNIDAIGSLSSLIIIGEQSQSLAHATINVLNVDEFNISCTNSIDNACYNAEVTASNVGSMNVACNGNRACHQSDWNINNVSDVTFDCNGQSSCIYMDIIADISNSIAVTTNDVTALQSSDINIQCDECLNIFNCMENITLFCGANEMPYSVGSDDECRNCMCDGTTTNAFIPFSNNMWQSCTPTSHPTVSPTTSQPTLPTINPTSSPTTAIPTFSPSPQPTPQPTVNPTPQPTPQPTDNPTLSPTSNPTAGPTDNPTSSPSPQPSPLPTESPSNNPTSSPSQIPTSSPTDNPTESPSDDPTSAPSPIPTFSPSMEPTMEPTITTAAANTTEFQIYGYGVVISIVFRYKVNENDTLNNTLFEVKNILNFIIETEVNGLFGNNTYCISDEYDVQIFELDHDKAIINATILVCNEDVQNDLSVEFEQDLETDFVETIKNKTSIVVDVEEVDVEQVDIISFTSTESIGIRDDDSEDNDFLDEILSGGMMTYIVFGMAALIICLCLIICIMCHKRRKHRDSKHIGEGKMKYTMELGAVSPHSPVSTAEGGTTSMSNMTPLGMPSPMSTIHQRVLSASSMNSMALPVPMGYSTQSRMNEGTGTTLTTGITTLYGDDGDDGDGGNDTDNDEDLYEPNLEMDDNVVTVGGIQNAVLSDVSTPMTPKSGEAKKNRRLQMEFHICCECKKEKTEKNGAFDKNDGNWYCNDCWNQFYE